ncbi:MAG: sulfocyanin-like copper-binding protein [Chloroflexota bacterium]
MNTFRKRHVLILMACVGLIAGACSSGAANPPIETIRPVTTAAPTVAATPVPSTVVAAANVPVSLTEWKVAVPETLKAGQVTFDITNDGSMQHEMLVFKSDLAPADYPVDANGDIIEEGAGVTLVSDGDNLDPKGTQSRTVDLSEPGAYLFVCNLPGHFKAGMFTVVTVVPATTAEVPITLSEWKVGAAPSIKAGEVLLAMMNSGSIEHELLVFKSDLPLASYPTDANGDIIEDGPGVTLISDGENIDPSGSQARALDLSQPGTYLFVCNIAGHFKAGMFQLENVVN